MGKIERGEHTAALALVLKIAKALGVRSALKFSWPGGLPDLAAAPEFHEL